MPRPRFSHRRIRPWRHRLPTAPWPTPGELLMLAAATVAMMALIGARAALAGATTSRIARPTLTTPADQATTAFAPSFAWKRVAGAARYEFQASADSAFESIVGNGTGSFKTVNTFATVDKALAEGDYFWRVRAIDKRDRASRWSPVRSFFKRWTVQLTSPPDDAHIEYPARPVVLTWNPVPGAYKYLFNIATDESMGHSLLGGSGVGVETSATAAAVPIHLAPGEYFWTVVPMDAQRHSGTQPTPFKFTVSWETKGLDPRVNNLFTPGSAVMDPQFTWTRIPGAATYQVEVNPADDWAVGSKVCCDEMATGDALSPLALLPNNTYHWRVRAINPDGEAGEWNYGADFTKAFLPEIEGLRVRDNIPRHVLPTGAFGEHLVQMPYTEAPVIQWDPVPGASSYDVVLAPWVDDPGGEPSCSWGSSVSMWTASTALTPLGTPTVQVPGVGMPAVSGWQPAPKGGSYCVLVRARTDRDAKQNPLVSDWTQLGGPGHPAFHYQPRFAPNCAGHANRMPESAYHDESGGTAFRAMPLLTWDWVPDACGYFVVVARDAAFTNIVDVAFTNHPAYAPRGTFGPRSYPDETTSYYWVVIPTPGLTGGGLSLPRDNPLQHFEKRSIAPRLMSPTPDSWVTGQPSFHWTPVEGALDYRIQVDDDPNFSSPIDDMRTHSTGFTSMKTYQTDSVLYWRVRADAENGTSSGTATGLNWSAGTCSQREQMYSCFHRDLPIPTTSPIANPTLTTPNGTWTNPTSGDTVPTLRWNPVLGAVSYDIHFEQSDGTKRDFNVRSTAFTPIAFSGTGVWRWQVRANYRSGFGTAASGYTPPAPFTRHIATPTGLKTTTVGAGALLSWAPAPMAKQYRVQISTSDSFAMLIDQATVDGASFAPHMTQPQFAGKGPLYWRVAAVDEGGNAGGWAMAPLRKPQSLRVKIRGALRHGRMGTLRVTVTDGRGRALNGAAVKASGKGLTASSRRTGRRGTTTLRLRPRSSGSLNLRVSLRSYTTRTVSVRVR
jgi:hypothetical protein